VSQVFKLKEPVLLDLLVQNRERDPASRRHHGYSLRGPLSKQPDFQRLPFYQSFTPCSYSPMQVTEIAKIAESVTSGTDCKCH